MNALALAYAGFTLVYPDIVGGTFGENHFSKVRTQQMETYMMRNAQWAALHSSMGMGEPPWSFSPKVACVMLVAAKLHARFAQDGYPWTMIPIAYPDDDMAYGRENATDRGYEWQIGDTMLAVPLYGNDYASAESRDVYLPKGQWMDFDTGKLFAGGQTLKAFPLPVGKTLLFIGGSGVTLEDLRGVVTAVVYPVAAKVSAILTLPDSPEVITINIQGLGAGLKWHTIHVADSHGNAAKVKVEGFGFGFVPKSGETYTVHAVR